MTGPDTETLRRALRSGMNQDAGGCRDTAGDGGACGGSAGGLDVTLIMDRGRRLRRRRRLAALAGGVCAIAALAGAATVVAGRTAAPPGGGQPVGPAHRAPATRGTQAPSRKPAHGSSATPVPVPRVPAARPSSTGVPSPSPTGIQSAATRQASATIVPAPRRASRSATIRAAATGPAPSATPTRLPTWSASGIPVATASPS